jgi:hypothetical protein
MLQIDTVVLYVDKVEFHGRDEKEVSVKKTLTPRIYGFSQKHVCCPG